MASSSVGMMPTVMLAISMFQETSVLAESAPRIDRQRAPLAGGGDEEGEEKLAVGEHEGEEPGADDAGQRQREW